MIFKFRIGGYFAINNWVNYKKSELHCYTSNYPSPPLAEDYLIIPLKGNIDWIRLIEQLAEFKWERDYFSLTDDGIQWELRVKGKCIDMKSYGSNAYPEDFATFIALLNNVIEASGIIIHDFT